MTTGSPETFPGLAEMETLLLDEDSAKDLDPSVEAVETFLADNAEIFFKSRAYWREAARTLETVVNEFGAEDTIAVAQTSRQSKRQISKSANLMRTKLKNGTRSEADKIAQAIIESNLYGGGDPSQPIDIDSLKADLGLILAGKKLDAQDAMMVTMSSDGRKHSTTTIAPQINEAHKKIVPPFVLARVYDSVAISRLHSLVSEASTASYFLDRITEMAALGNLAPEYPGLLEIIATDHAVHGKKSIISECLASVGQGPAELARSFIEEALESNETVQKNRYTKELTAAFGVLRSVATMFEGAEPMSREDFIDKYVSRLDVWPEALKSALDTYSSRITQELTEHAKLLLQPHKRLARVTPTKNAAESVHTHEHGFMGHIPKQIAAKPAPIEQEEHEAEPTPISSFAILKRVGSKSPRLRPEAVESINSIVEHPIIADYLKKHCEEPTLKDSIYKVISHICEKPFDSHGTKIIRAGTYSLDTGGTNSKHRNRRLRRFKPTSVPGVHGVIAVQTRLFYDIILVGGHPTLAIYGIGIKQDVRDIGGNLSLK